MDHDNRRLYKGCIAQQSRIVPRLAGSSAERYMVYLSQYIHWRKKAKNEKSLSLFQTIY
jgi:hypothetical protein